MCVFKNKEKPFSIILMFLMATLEMTEVTAQRVSYVFTRAQQTGSLLVSVLQMHVPRAVWDKYLSGRFLHFSNESIPFILVVSSRKTVFGGNGLCCKQRRHLGFFTKAEI